MRACASGLRRIPIEAWVCAIVACLNAVSWSLITPPFQVPDETDHFAYVQLLTRRGELPSSTSSHHSQIEEVALRDLHSGRVRHRPGSGKPISTQAQQRHLEKDLARLRGIPEAPHSAGLAGSEPPLYYALATVPYELGSSGSLLDRLALVRLLSALMAAATALFTFLFLREALPAARWSWIVGGLGVALFPLLGFMAGGVTPEGMLYAVSAALFFALARAFRLGLTRRRAAAIGAALLLGLLTKLNFIGLLPGAALGLVLLTRRGASTSKREAYGSLLLATAIVAVPLCLYLTLDAVTGHAGLGAIVSNALQLTSNHGSLAGELSYIWQFYLPRLPGMHSDFVGLSMTRGVWFNGMVGLYGWLDTTFPQWVYEAALLPAGLIAVLAGRTVIAGRAVLRGRRAELAVYLLMAVGLMVLVGADGYIEFPREVANYAEPRYLLPLLPCWGAVLALAGRGAGRRWGPLAGGLIVAVALAHDILSQLLVISRYYG